MKNLQVKKISKHYVEYIFAGAIVSETSSKEIEERDPELAKSMMPKPSYGFRFYDEDSIEVEGKTYEAEKENYSGWYLCGREYTLNEVKELQKTSGENLKILIENMEANKFSSVARTCVGGWVTFQPNDIILAADAPWVDNAEEG